MHSTVYKFYIGSLVARTLGSKRGDLGVVLSLASAKPTPKPSRKSP